MRDAYARPALKGSDGNSGASTLARQILAAGLILFALVLAASYLSGRSSSPQALAAGRHNKILRAIDYRKSKAVCTNPLPGQAHCLAKITVGLNGRPLTGTPAGSGSYGPAQFHTAYQLPCMPGGSIEATCPTPSAFGPQTIAIVDAGNFSSGASGLESSLSGYDQYYSLPDCTTANGCLDVINQSGATSPLPADAGWSDEIALDVETAHMVCQTCKILLVEANNTNDNSLAAADAMAASFNPVAISNSWGGGDDPTYDSDFEHTGIAVVASTGDSGGVGSGQAWPADIPDVVAASGTNLQLNTDNTWASETVWSGSGGGCAVNYTAPTWQTSLSDWATNGCGAQRAFGDVSADADPSTGAAIDINGTWYEIGGTSLSSPLIAGMFALTGGVPSSTTASSIPYSLFSGSNYHDITSGNDCAGSVTTHCTASTGFDTPSGLGSPSGVSGFMGMLSPAASLATSDVTQNQVKLTWAASGASGITGYYVYRNNTQIASVTGTSYTDTGLTPNTGYNYYVVAHNGSGGLSGPSAAAAATTYYSEDINEDGHINLLDLSILASKWGQTSNLGRADINGDGKVDLLDLSLLAQYYGTE